MRHILGGMLAAALASGALAQDSPRHSVDHIVLGVNNLQFGMAQLKALTGVDPVIGGVHPSLGTHNALISLGDESYLELLAPNPDADPASVSAMGSSYLQKIQPLRQVTPVLWALGSTDLEKTRGLLGDVGIELGEPAPGSRRKPDGSLLQWQTAELISPGSAAAPFFIQWAGPGTPAHSTPKGCTLSRLSLAADGQLRTMLQTLAVPVDFVEQGDAPISIELSCPTGLVVLP